MKDRIHALLDLCMQAKEKGIDAFFRYSPHVGTVRVDIYSPHWVSPEKDDNGEYIEGTDNFIWGIDFYVSGERVSEIEFDGVMAYLKELIE